MKLHRIAAVTVKESLDILRDPVTLAVALLMPLIMLFLFSYAISLDIDEVPLGVLDFDRTPQSRQLTDRFVQSGYFRLVDEYRDDHAVERALQSSTIKLALVIPLVSPEPLSAMSPPRFKCSLTAPTRPLRI